MDEFQLHVVGIKSLFRTKEEDVFILKSVQVILIAGIQVLGQILNHVTGPFAKSVRIIDGQ